MAVQRHGRQYDCRITFFTLQLGIVFHLATYRDVVMQGSGLLSRLLAQTKATGFTAHACNIDKMEAFLSNGAPLQNGVVTWVFRYLQFHCKSTQPMGKANTTYCTRQPLIQHVLFR